MIPQGPLQETVCASGALDCANGIS